MLEKPFALIAFEPRQVTLAKQQKMKNNKSSSETLIQKSSKKDKKKKSNKELSPLLLAISEFLEHKGFSKTLAAFKSEALIEELDGLNGHSLDLEAMYNKYLETSKSDGKMNDNSSEKLDSQIEEVAGKDKSKEKKKKSKLVSDLSNENTQKDSLEVFQGDEPDRKSKDKKKKKGKSTTESLAESAEQGGLCESRTVDKSAEISSEGPLEEKNVKSKDKKKKKNKLTTESLSGDSKKTDSKKENLPIAESNAVNVEKKETKKRKRLESEENESQPDDKIESKEQKQSKTKGSEEDKGKDDLLKANALLENDGHAGKKRKMGNGQHESDKSFTSPQQPSATERSTKKQHNGSTEPKTVNAFKRVDIEKVEFVDERLQDNSYWAKDGADSGYGAKAQEVLGQVRGRDFRHEKTKKKRGSYRGGQIDLQSHSFKFNYGSDEE